MAYLTIPHHRSSDTLPTHSVPRHLLKLTRVTQAQLRTTVVVAVAEEMPVEGAGGLEKNTTPFAIHLVVVLCWLRPHFGGWDGEGLGLVGHFRSNDGDWYMLSDIAVRKSVGGREREAARQITALNSERE